MKQTEGLPAVLFGGTFGELYADALASGTTPYRLVGIGGRGGGHSRRLAEKFQVPLFSERNQFPADIELACVVVRSGLLGGEGSVIAQDFLQRGIAVVQEHPVHYRELADNIRTARKHRTRYYLNTFYDQLTVVKKFIDVAQDLDQRADLLHLELAVSYQVAYAAVDILALIGQNRIELESDTAANAYQPKQTVHFKRVNGRLRPSLTFGMRIDMSMDPSDPDDHPHLLLRAELICATGTLLLADTQGPVLWLPRPYVPRGRSTGPERLIEEHLPAESRSFSQSVHQGWPEAVGRLLQQVGKERDSQVWIARAQRHLEVSRSWSDISKVVGPPFLKINRESDNTTASAQRVDLDA